MPAGRPRRDAERIIIGLPADLIAALDAVAGTGQRGRYIENLLRTDPKIQEAFAMTQAYIMGQIFARIERSGIPMSPNSYHLVSTDPAHQFPLLFRRLIESGHKDDIADLMEQISADTGFPDHMTNDQQGQFSLGYYHEKESIRP